MVNKKLLQNYVMMTDEFGFDLYIAETEKTNCPITDKKDEALIWDERDVQSIKLEYWKTLTGYKELQWEIL